MKIELLKPSFTIYPFESYESMLKRVEREARRCYKSEMSNDPAKFIRKLLNSGHESPIEHAMLSVEFIVDRGVTHELVRHRLASYSQESTRYVDYSGLCQFIIPPWLALKPGIYEYTEYDGIITYNGVDQGQENTVGKLNADDHIFLDTLSTAAEQYKYVRSQEKWSPQKARAFLPSAMKTEIGVTANVREWRHILKLRSAKNCHPQMIEVIQPLKQQLAKDYPAFFADIATPIL
jgi:thymidylate synthase (FAD)